MHDLNFACFQLMKSRTQKKKWRADELFVGCCFFHLTERAVWFGDIASAFHAPRFEAVSAANERDVGSALTFDGVDHLSVEGGRDDGLGQILQVPAQAVAQGGQFQLVQLGGGRIWNAAARFVRKPRALWVANVMCVQTQNPFYFLKLPLCVYWSRFADWNITRFTHTQTRADWGVEKTKQNKNILTTIIILPDFESTSSGERAIQSRVIRTCQKENTDVTPCGSAELVTDQQSQLGREGEGGLSWQPHLSSR